MKIKSLKTLLFLCGVCAGLFVVSPWKTNQDLQQTQYFRQEKEIEEIKAVQVLPTKNSFSFDLKKPKAIDDMNSMTALINKANYLSKDYKPKDLIIPNIPFGFEGTGQKKHLRKEAAQALEKLVVDSKKEGLKLYGASGYRSYDRQSSLYNNYVKQHGQKSADTFSAKPGYSEHQSGLAMDMTTPSIGYGIDDSFGKTKEAAWLAKNAHRYGFIIRYPKDKGKITLYKYEPWHLRYVGKDLAKHLYDNALTLEEYYLSIPSGKS